jgi:hypothetical protein
LEGRAHLAFLFERLVYLLRIVVVVIRHAVRDGATSAIVYCDEKEKQIEQITVIDGNVDGQGVPAGW